MHAWGQRPNAEKVPYSSFFFRGCMGVTGRFAPMCCRTWHEKEKWEIWVWSPTSPNMSRTKGFPFSVAAHPGPAWGLPMHHWSSTSRGFHGRSANAQHVGQLAFGFGPGWCSAKYYSNVRFPKIVVPQNIYFEKTFRFPFWTIRVVYPHFRTPSKCISSFTVSNSYNMF